MKLNKENVRPVIARLFASGQLPCDGPVSVFIQEKHKGWLSHRQQIVVSTKDSAVFVRCSRLPFARPIVFSLGDFTAAKS